MPNFARMGIFSKIWTGIRGAADRTAARIRKFGRFASVEIWRKDFLKDGKFSHRMARNFKVAMLMFATFSTKNIGLQAKALSYLVTMSIIPLLALVFTLSDGFGLSEAVYTFVQSTFDDQQALDTVKQVTDYIARTTQSGLFGIISLGILLWMVIWMMICVERVFNIIWDTRRKRPVYHQLLGISMVILTTPLMMALFVYGSLGYYQFLDFLFPSAVLISGKLRIFFSWVGFCAIATLVISVMYKFIPTERVKYGTALTSAFVAGIAFTIMQILYVSTQIFVTRMNEIYGALMAIPLFLTWLNIGWTIILYGAALSFALQKVDDRNVSDAVLDQKLKSLRANRRRKKSTEVIDIIKGIKVQETKTTSNIQ